MRDMLRKAKLRLCSFGSFVLWISLRSPFDLLYRLNCHVDKQPVVKDLFFAGFWTAGNSRHGEQITGHNLTTKPLIQNLPILFQDNTAVSLHCTFQSLIFINCGDMRNNYLTESHTHSLTHTHAHDNYRMPPGLRPPRHKNVMTRM